jgi:hypothetical protein
MRSQLPYWHYDQFIEADGDEVLPPPSPSRYRREGRTTHHFENLLDDEELSAGYASVPVRAGMKAAGGLRRAQTTETIRTTAPQPSRSQSARHSVFRGSLGWLCLMAFVGYLAFFGMMRLWVGTYDLLNYGPRPTAIATLPPVPGGTLPRSVMAVNDGSQLTVILPNEQGTGAQIVTVPLDQRAWGNVAAVVPVAIEPSQGGDIVITLQGEPALFPAWERPAAKVHLARQANGQYRLVSIVPAE